MLPQTLEDLASWFLEQNIVQVSDGPQHDFILRHGGTDPLYFDLRLPKDAKLGKGLTPHMGIAIAWHLEELVSSKAIICDLLAGVPRAGDPFADSLATIIKKRALFLDKDGDERIKPLHFTDQGMGEIILPIENVTSTGLSGAKAVDVFREGGYRVNQLLSVIDRESGGEEVLAKKGVELVSLFKMSDLLYFYVRRGQALPESCTRALEHAAQLKQLGAPK